MKSLAISAEACTETLGLLVAMAWADGRLDEREREGVRAAAQLFELPPALRARIEAILTKPIGFDEILVESLTARERAFALVAAAWLSGIDRTVDAKENALLERVAVGFGFDATRKEELVALAREMEPAGGAGAWAKQLVTLFKAIPARLATAEDRSLG